MKTWKSNVPSTDPWGTHADIVTHIVAVHSVCNKILLKVMVSDQKHYSH